MMSASGLQDGSPVPTMSLSHLDQGSALHIFTFLQPRQVAAAASTCKLFRELASLPALWHLLYEKEIPDPIKDILDKEQGPTDTSTDWRLRVHQGLALRDLRTGQWDPVTPVVTPGKPRVRPSNREGHAACSWGPDSTSLLLFGGWGGGIHNDLYVLERTGQGEGEVQWRALRPSGEPPEIRYGHSITRCGRHGDMALVFGGMQCGGYTGEIVEVAVLRPVEGADITTTSTAYEWYHPTLTGSKPLARGYHAACASQDGTKVYIFGGIRRHDCCNNLAVIDVETWECELIPMGPTPLPRFGCSLAEFDGGLWVVGGGHGHDLARSGFDLEDVWRLDLATKTWTEIHPVNKPHNKLALGRCHAYVTLGSKLVLYGGSLQLSQDITWFDMATRSWGQPTITGTPPASRMSAVMAVCGSDIVLFGGWIYARGEMGDLHRLKLVLNEQQLNDIRSSAQRKRGKTSTKTRLPVCPRAELRNPWGTGSSGCNIAAGPSCPAGASWYEDDPEEDPTLDRPGSTLDTQGAAADGDSQSWWQKRSVPTDGECSRGGCLAGGLVVEDSDAEAGPSGGGRGRDRAGGGRNSTAVQEAISKEMATYFGLLREAQQQEERGDVPAALLQAMQASTSRLRALRMQGQSLATGWLYYAFDGTDSEEAEEEEEEEEEEEWETEEDGGDTGLGGDEMDEGAGADKEEED